MKPVLMSSSVREGIGMKEAIAIKWAEALESGKYVQGNRALRINTGVEVKFCCLGVLCNISGLGSWVQDYYYVDDERAGGYLPGPVMEWAGVTSRDPKLTSDQTATQVNDDMGTGFKEIARLIRENWQTM